jgi:hypothetical protein
MTYNPLIPQAGDFLSVSQGQILNNFSKANTSFGIDHYPFSDLTANNGKHNKITTPVFVDNPPSGLPPVTIAAEPKMYAFQDSANVGVINYSRGPLNSVPTPITNLQSPSTALVMAPTTTINVLDFTGLARAFCLLFAGNAETAPTLARVVALIFWTGAPANILTIDVLSGTSLLTPQVSSTILQIKNSSPLVSLLNVYWTLQMQRLS